MTADVPRARTLGELLDEAGRRLAARHLPVYPWAAACGVLLERADVAGQPCSRGGSSGSKWPPGGLDALDLRRSQGRGPRPGRLRRPTARPRRRPGTGTASTRAARCRTTSAGALRDVAGPAADAMRVHDDGAADALARAHRADAVTVGQRRLLPARALPPAPGAGFALLAHEATPRPGRCCVPWQRLVPRRRRRGRRGGARGPGECEQAARAWPRPSAAAARALAAPRRRRRARGRRRPPPPAAAATARPRRGRAARWRPPADRRPGRARGAGTAGPGGPAAHLIDDLMRQLRTEFERGG